MLIVLYKAYLFIYIFLYVVRYELVFKLYSAYAQSNPSFK